MGGRSSCTSLGVVKEKVTLSNVCLLQVFFVLFNFPWLSSVSTGGDLSGRRSSDLSFSDLFHSELFNPRGSVRDRRVCVGPELRPLYHEVNLLIRPK